MFPWIIAGIMARALYLCAAPTEAYIFRFILLPSALAVAWLRDTSSSFLHRYQSRRPWLLWSTGTALSNSFVVLTLLCVAWSAAQESHVIQDYGFDDFAGSFPYAMLLALYVLYSLIAFCLFVTPVFATKRVVESRGGGPPLVPVAQKEAPVRPVGKERRASMASPARSASSRKSYGSIGTISQKLPAPLSRYKEQKQACVLQYVDINYQVRWSLRRPAAHCAGAQHDYAVF